MRYLIGAVAGGALLYWWLNRNAQLAPTAPRQITLPGGFTITAPAPGTTYQTPAGTVTIQ